MNPPHEELVSTLASEADDLLAEATRAEAAAILMEKLIEDHPEVSAAERKPVVAAVIALLDSEEFFAGVRERADDWDESDFAEDDGE